MEDKGPLMDILIFQSDLSGYYDCVYDRIKILLFLISYFSSRFVETKIKEQFSYVNLHWFGEKVFMMISYLICWITTKQKIW